MREGEGEGKETRKREKGRMKKEIQRTDSNIIAEEKRTNRDQIETQERSRGAKRGVRAKRCPEASSVKNKNRDPIDT